MVLKQAVCSCGIKTEIPLMSDIKIDKDTLLNSFTNINNIANIKLMQCYNVIFQKKYILKNIGFYIYACLIALDLACLLYFIIRDYKNLIKEIDNIKFYLLNNKRKNFNNNETNNINKNKKRKKKFNYKNYKVNGRYLTIVWKSNYIIPPIFRDNIGNNLFNKKFYQKYNKFKEKSIIDSKNNSSSINKSYNLFLHNNEIKLNKKYNNKKANSLIKLNYNEMNNLSFKEALSKDKRNFIQYYTSLLKTKHSLIYIFYTKDYNSKIIKVSIQIFNLATLISVNSLFFSDETMHKIYVDKGSFNFVYQLPQIIYSTIISSVLNMLIQLLGLTEDIIIIFKNSKLPNRNLEQKYNKLIKIITIKFIFFYILSFSLLFLYWYYVTCFCGIYRNTQIHLLKDSLFSFITSLITPFGIYLIPGAFRIWALKRKSKILYGLSKILQML